MARNRTISPDFWTWEAVIDCAPMTRLLFLGLWTFADDHGVQPLRPRTIRMQVFPGDAVDTEAVRAMIDELAARKLVWMYEVEGLEYLAIVDWALHLRIGKRAKRRFPSAETIENHRNPSLSSSALDEGLPGSKPATETIANHSNPSFGLQAPSPSGPSAAPDLRGKKEEEPERWRGMIKDVLAKWIAEGCDFGDDMAPAVRDFYIAGPFSIPPAGFQQLDEGVTAYRLRREARRPARIGA